MTLKPAQKLLKTSILKTFYNGKEVPLIPPMFINKKLEPDFKLKAKLF